MSVTSHAASPAGEPGAGQPLISVDVVPLYLDRSSGSSGPGELGVVVGERLFEPHLGAPALPGVLLAHERVDEAALRALRTKVGVEQPSYLADAGVFDNPDRDPRGPTLSISKVAVLRALPPVVEGQPRTHLMPLSTFARPVAVAETPRVLPFDHDQIVRAACSALLARFWSEPDPARALVGESFTIKSLIAALSGLAVAAGATPSLDAGNVQRSLRRTGWAHPTAPAAPARGRPPLMWTWNDR